jgi:8-oxo-dGTP pyrophosphatase MutT (NUDIX family)
MTKISEEARPASTVVLVRPHGTGFEVYLLKRSGQSGFFPGSYVFPGGAVASEDRDAGLWLRHSDLDLPGVERRLGGTLPATEMLAYGVAAIRETFEEGGVLLASRAQEIDSGMQAIGETRKVKKLSKGWFREWAVSGGWYLQLSRLARWTHWITPEAFKPRFDTRFFLWTRSAALTNRRPPTGYGSRQSKVLRLILEEKFLSALPPW